MRANIDRFAAMHHVNPCPNKVRTDLLDRLEFKRTLFSTYTISSISPPAQSALQMSFGLRIVDGKQLILSSRRKKSSSGFGAGATTSGQLLELFAWCRANRTFIWSSVPGLVTQWECTRESLSMLIRHWLQCCWDIVIIRANIINPYAGLGWSELSDFWSIQCPDTR